jgi:hypothetical protein
VSTDLRGSVGLFRILAGDKEKEGDEEEALRGPRVALPRLHDADSWTQQQQQTAHLRELEEANDQLRRELAELGLDYKGVSVQLQAATRLAEELQAKNPDVSKAAADAVAHERAVQDIRNQKARRGRNESGFTHVFSASSLPMSCEHLP